MTYRVLVSAPYMLPVIEEYRHRLVQADVEIIIAPVKERLSEAELLPLVGDLDGVMCGDDQFTERVLKAAPKLRVISKWGTGIDSIDIEAAATMGILVCNTPGAFTDPVADTVMGYLLTFDRELPWMNSDMREGIWEKRSLLSLRETTLGVVGVGNVGSAVVRRAVSFGMRVLGNDIAKLPTPLVAETNLEVVSLVQLLKESDFVSLNCDLNRTSHHLIASRELSLMKSTAYLINTSRGPVIHEPALIDALQRHRIAGAALDVFEVEPLPEDSSLRKLDNCLLAPHNANSSPQAALRVHENTLRNLLHGLGIGEVQEPREREGNNSPMGA